jgi:hypothetical protein
MPRRPKATLGRAIDEVLNALEGLDGHSRRVALRVAAFHFGLIRPDEDPFKDAAAPGRTMDIPTERPQPAGIANINPLPVRRRGRPRKIQIPAGTGSAPSAGSGSRVIEEVPDV